MIYATLPLDSAELDYLRAGVGEEELVYGPALAADRREGMARRADIILGNPPVDWLRKNDQLKWLQLKSAGFSEYTELQDRELGYVITNCTGLFGTPVAETALAGVLALLREVPTFVRDQESRHWRGAAIRPTLGKLTGSRVIVLGHGSIGGTFRRLLNGFDCRVETMGRRGAADFHTREELDDRLPGADVVMAALPETEETIGLFGADRIALMGSSCIFVNVGRGSLVDEAALLHRLRSGNLGGAVLDVTQREPLPADDPLWQAPRTLLTQHSAGGAADETRRIIDRFLKNLIHYRTGHPLQHVVALKRGY